MSVQDDKAEAEVQPADIARFADALNVFIGKLGGETTLDRLFVLLRIAYFTASQRKIEQVDLSSQVSLTKDVLSRHVNLLSDEGDRGKKGLGLVQVGFGAARSRVLSTNAEANRLVVKAVKLMKPPKEQEKTK